jgi:hypothetical protein
MIIGVTMIGTSFTHTQRAWHSRDGLDEAIVLVD